MTTYLDLTGDVSDREPTEAEIEQLQASWKMMSEFTNRVNQFIDRDYQTYAVAKEFPEISEVDEKTMRFWERLMAHANLRAYISGKIAERTGIQGTGTNWVELEDDSLPENPTDAATEDVVAGLDDAFTRANEKTRQKPILLLLDGNRLINRDFPARDITLSKTAATLATIMKKDGTPIDVVCRVLQQNNKHAIRQAVYRFNQRVKGNLQTGGSVIVGERNGNGYRWIESVSIDVRNQAD